MSKKQQTLAEEQADAAKDRAEALSPKLARFKLRGAMIAAADATPWHKLAYKVHGAARRIKA